MDMTIRPMLRAEHNYSYSQSQQISMQTRLIGHLRGDMDANGNGFFTSWDDFRASLKTEEFKAEFDEVINALRSDSQFGGVLKNRDALAAYCRAHPESAMPDTDGRFFGFRVDTDKHSYMLRLDPYRGEYNIYCYCYRRDWLDNHLSQAERGIRFITPDYKEIFTIPDGEKIRITHGNGEQIDRTCRYIDPYHLEVGRELYHICEFAERMQNAGSTVIPLRSSLPERCYGVLPSTGEVIEITRGEDGYRDSGFRGGDPEANRKLASDENERLGVDKAQEAAMVAGSMFGWAVPAADPKNYDDSGAPIKPRNKSNDAR